MTISDEAVEASCRAEFSDWDRNGDEWWRGMTRKRMRAALEAAAPHMLADCWDASAKATADYELEYRVNFDFGDDPPEPPTNPYGPTK